ncbi:hypothetical protein CDD83_5556 [Cordyceps sp. RAO-2017]|nr:hypothetical protein CDD83_5556 [Cordyceps sp. RAO-2017]
MRQRQSPSSGALRAQAEGGDPSRAAPAQGEAGNRTPGEAKTKTGQGYGVPANDEFMFSKTPVADSTGFNPAQSGSNAGSFENGSRTGSTSWVAKAKGWIRGKLGSDTGASPGQGFRRPRYPPPVLPQSIHDEPARLGQPWDSGDYAEPYAMVSRFARGKHRPSSGVYAEPYAVTSRFAGGKQIRPSSGGYETLTKYNKDQNSAGARQDKPSAETEPKLSQAQIDQLYARPIKKSQRFGNS